MVSENKELLLGIDDAGRGPVLGPMVLAGCLIEKNKESEFKLAGAKDSKLLSASQRERILIDLRKIAKEYKYRIITPIEIDTGMGEGLNLNQVEALASASIINEITDTLSIAQKQNLKIILDCPSINTSGWKNQLMGYVKDKKLEPKIACEHKADFYHVVVSAASILAKVTRDAEIEKIKQKIGIDFGSLPFDEEILIEKDGILNLEKIGNLKKKDLSQVNIFSLDKKTLKIERAKVTQFIEHPKTDVYQLFLERGKTIKLSLNHPLFVLNENAEIISKKLKNIKIGEHIAVAGNINRDNALDHINLITLLKDYSTKESPIYIYGEKITTFLKTNKSKIIQLAMTNNYDRTSFYSWLKKEAMPINIFNKLDSKIDLKECFLGSREEQIKMPIIFPITPEFMWFLGIFLAEGWTTKYNVCVSSQDKYVFDRIRKFSKKYNLVTHTNKDWIAFSSILFVKLIKATIVGDNAYNKKIPDFVFSCSKRNIKSLLDGLYEGDGYLRKNTLDFEIELRSKEIIKQLQWLNLMLNKFCSNRYRRDKNAFIAHIMSKSTNSLSPDNIPAVIGSYLRFLRQSKLLSQSQLAKKINIASRVLNSIEKQRVKVIEKKTLEKIIKIIPNKKLSLLLNSDLCWLKVMGLKKIGKERVYDLGVKGNENFIGGQTGIVLHNSGYPSDPYTVAFLKKHVLDFKKEGIFRESWSTWQTAKREALGTKEKTSKQEKLF